MLPTRRARLCTALPALGAWACATAAAQVPPAEPDCQRIGEVHIVRTDVFDTRIAQEDRALFRLANTLHLDTRESTVKQLLLVKPGDPYEPRLLRESERLMRATGYLHDATIRVLGCANGEAELEVAVQDVWTLKPSLSLGRKGGANSSAFGIEESNLFGLGTQLGLDFRSGVDRSSRMLSYHDPLLGGRRLDLTASYADNSDGTQTRLGLDRPFYSLDTPWAAGVTSRRETRIDSVYELGQVVGQYQVSERHATAYAGRSSGWRDGWVTRWTAGWTQDEHLARPLGAPGIPPTGVAADRRLNRPWVGVEWLQDNFRQTRNFDQIGKTEDLALGWQMSLQLGLARQAFGADRNATVFSFKVNKGWQPARRHTLLVEGSAEGRYEAQSLAGTLFSGSVRYHLRQSDRRSFFVGLSADRSVHPDPDQQVLIGGDSGLRGYPMRYQSGKGRWLATTEQRWFTDWYPWRVFNVGGAVFYDMGRTWDQTTTSSATGTPPRLGLLRDWGFGLRLGNSRSAIGSVVHIDLAFPLDGDPSIQKVQFLVEAKRSF